MKKQSKIWLSCLLVIAVFLSFVSGCKQKENTSADNSTKIVANGSVTEAESADSNSYETKGTIDDMNATTIIKLPTTDVSSSVSNANTGKSANKINAETVNYFAYCNGNLITSKPRGIVLDFHGLGGTEMFYAPSEIGQICVDKSILYVQPYDNPWSWMNDLAVRYTDEIVDAIIDKYDLPDNIPIVTMGGSMGGLSCLIYTLYAKRTPVACAASCPVTDLPYHYTERPDLPRTIYQAFMHYSGDIDKAIESASPYHQAANFPKNTTYLIVAGDADTAVNKTMHSDRFVQELKKNCKNVIYTEVAGMGHCALPDDEKEKYFKFIVSDEWFGD